jgi:3'-phosphoadenosine 5'-phosphosulfate sulfotransferase (PAPS reductase)/FAD synthetase
MRGISYPKCWALVSGGKDSLSNAQALDEAGRLYACIAIKTHLCTPDWEQFVIDTCNQRKWGLEIYEAEPTAYEDYVQKYGFPGPSKHRQVMTELKGKVIRKFRRAWPKAILASGVRSDESTKRAATTKPVGFWEGAPILAPIYDWTTDETWAFFRDRGFERAPAYSTLQISGDCLCGAYAREDEFRAIEFHYPEVAGRLKALGEAVKEKHPTRCQWGWGAKMPMKPKTSSEALVCVECAPRDLFEEVPA